VTSSATEQLEGALAQSFDHATLAVYADHLQAQGDVRGELIAIDLEIAQRGTTAALLTRRSELLHTWLGRLVAFDVADSFRFGFLERVELLVTITPDHLVALLAHPAGRFVRGLALRGTNRELEAALAALAATRHAWLATLALSTWDHHEPRIADASTARLIAATPVLARLELGGGHMIDELPHPHVRELKITGTGTFAGIYGDGPSLPDARILDIAFDDDGIVEQPVVDRTLMLSELRLPALTVLDLSRNEPLDPEDASFTMRGHSLWSFLGHQELRRQLTHLKLPALRNDNDTAELMDVLASMPLLEHVELARGNSYQVPPLYHPRAKFTIASRWPWPARATTESLRVIIPGARSPEVVHLHVALAAMPAVWAQLPDDARAAWTAVWGALGGTVPLDTLLLAIESLGERLDEGGWRELREALIDHRVPGARVELRHG
jgi:hypothetical protein